MVLIGIRARELVELDRRRDLLCVQISDGGHRFFYVTVFKKRTDLDRVSPRLIEGRTRNGDMRHRIELCAWEIAPAGHVDLHRVSRDRSCGNVDLILSDPVKLGLEDRGGLIALCEVGRKLDIRIQQHHRLTKPGSFRDHQIGSRFFDVEIEPIGIRIESAIKVLFAGRPNRNKDKPVTNRPSRGYSYD